MTDIKDVIAHLKRDKETWLKLSKQAEDEATSDMLLIEKLYKKSEEVS
jgi:hypothetical protein